MQRVMILGGPGSGKSTLARVLGERTGLPVHHMDMIHHLPGWQERPLPEKIEMAHAVERGAAWIFEGGLSATYDHRAARADTIIWLDLGVGLRLWRVTKRLFRYLGQTRPDLPEGCKERLHPETLAFYGFIWRTLHTSRARILRLLKEQPEGKIVVCLRNPAEVQRYLDGLRST